MPTFSDVWRSIRVNCPDATVTLVRRWVQNAYRQLADQRQWSWKVLEGQIVWAGTHDVTDVVTTFGSAVVTGPAATFVAADAGRQFRVGTYPIYTVLSVDSATQITLDRPYEGQTSGTVQGHILDAYTTLPANFENFLAIVDPTYQRLVPWWATWMELDRIDPIRQAGGPPRLLGARKLSEYPPTLGQAQYEFYPKPSVRGALQFYAVALPLQLADNDPLPGTLGARVDVLEVGALAQAARWPGLAGKPNPYFNLNLGRQLSADFHDLCVQLDIRDDDVYQQSIDNQQWQKFNSWGWAYDTHLLQQTDATLASFAGYGSFAPW